MTSRLFVLTLFFGIFISFSSPAQKPTRWRGPEANGIYPDKGLLQSWPVTGPEILWTYEDLGQGYSSPVISAGNIYITGMIDAKGYLFKLDMEGNLVYRVAYGPEYTESYYGSRGSAVIAGDRIYIISGHGHLYCLREGDGKEVWSVDMVKEFGGKVIRWGYNETVSIDGDVLYCTPGGRKNNVIALNRQNGSLIWSSPGKGDLSAYCSPLLFEHGGKKILATHTASNILGIDAGTGELLWSYSHTNQYAVHANTPVYGEGGLIFFSGYGKGAVKLELNADGTESKIAWKKSEFDSRMGGAVLIDGYVYCSGDNNREWMAVDWKTGETSYTSSDISKGNVIYADGMLYCYSERGELALVKANPEKFDIISQVKVSKGSDQHWAHIAIQDGVLYLRHGKALIAYKIK